MVPHDAPIMGIRCSPHLPEAASLSRDYGQMICSMTALQHPNKREKYLTCFTDEMPSVAPLEHVLLVLQGYKVAPPSRFLSYTGPLSPWQLTSLCAALKHSPYAGGLRLKGTGHADDAHHTAAEEKESTDPSLLACRLRAGRCRHKAGLRGLGPGVVSGEPGAPR
jgi:hypothetical protein